MARPGFKVARCLCIYFWGRVKKAKGLFSGGVCSSLDVGSCIWSFHGPYYLKSWHAICLKLGNAGGGQNLHRLLTFRDLKQNFMGKHDIMSIILKLLCYTL